MQSALVRRLLVEMLRRSRLYLAGYWIVVGVVVFATQHSWGGPRSSSVARVTVGTSVSQPEKDIPLGAHPLWCIADMRGVAAGSVVEFTWVRLLPKAGTLFTVAVFYEPSRAAREQSYYSMLLARGSYACRVQVNNRTYGSATFSIR